ncbi:Gfo/Idh/MocA family oxidoreductase [Roseiconus nitratireducens]|uniref:Gfo/Idh/MocA family oxidoreductase n=1 Tax=Roseiconus nitratireducens TaxID=2605748 RepID=A0A5M6DBX8_9BACT|nr:Gfo/Idh/MocA family oxidoreductase [Roseiconus nitratireducens]KAA5542655.1 Gfo/Idh/MocA family oxidoreductase [Roseiconus nitratireducens]
MMTRRRFLKHSAAAITTATLSSGVWSEVPAADSLSANQKLKLLCVGTANRARANIEGVDQEDIVALCDVDGRYLEAAKSKYASAATYRDYREMIDAEADKADAIVIATADHNHAPAAIRAIGSGLHCYCEKPLTHTVHEARVIAEAAKQAGVVTQMGTQIHAGDNYRRVVEIIRSKAIGDVQEVHVWVGKGWGGGDRPEHGDVPPPHLDWDLWLGPAPERPYAEGRYHPANWRRWWDFGQGTLGDMGCHYMDLPFWALDLRHPTHVRAEGPEVHPETCPLGLKVHYQFPARGDAPPVKLTWYDGNLVPSQVNGKEVPGSGVMFVGDAGEMFANYGSYRLYPEEKFQGYEPPPATIPRSIGHHREWIQACKEGGETTCNFDYSGALTESVLLGNVAFRAGKPLRWDAKQLRATNCPEADALIRKQYRSGWEVAAELPV